MLIRRKRGWELPESAATDEAVYLDRRRLMQGLAAGPILAAGLLRGRAAVADDADPSAGLYPARRNDKYTLDRPLTDEKYPTTYNNFYEFGTDKDIWQRRAGAQDPALDDQDRRHGREADDHRHRRSAEEDAARGAALPPSLRRGLVDGGAVERLPARRAGRYGEAARLGQVPQDDDLPWTPAWRRARSNSSIPGPMSRA